MTLSFPLAALLLCAFPLSAMTPSSATLPRPRPGFSSAAWRLTDTVHAPAEAAAMGRLAFDGDPATRWTTGRPMCAGDQFTLDMGKVQTVARVTLDTSAAPDDTPRGYTLEGSLDGKAWTERARASAEEVRRARFNGVFTIRFPAARTRYLRMTNHEEKSDRLWSVQELAVYGPPVYTEQVRVAEGGWGRMIRLKASASPSVNADPHPQAPSGSVTFVVRNAKSGVQEACRGELIR